MTPESRAALARHALLMLRAIAPRGRRDTAVVRGLEGTGATSREVCDVLADLERDGLAVTETRNGVRWLHILPAGAARVEAWDAEQRARDAAAHAAGLDAVLVEGLAP